MFCVIYYKTKISEDRSTEVKQRCPGYEASFFYAEAATEGVLSKRCSLKFRKIHKKTPVPESLFLIKRLWHSCFPVDLAKFSRTPFLQNTSDGCLGSLSTVTHRLGPYQISMM